MGKPTTIVSVFLAELAPELGIKVHIEPEYGYVGQIKTKDGRIFYYRSTNFDINGQGASELAKDKRYTAYFLDRMGYPSPKGQTFCSEKYRKLLDSDKNIAAACAYAKKLGYPVIVKPNDKSMGYGVEKVYTEKALITALNFIFDEIKDDVAVVEEFITGQDYRIVVVDNEIIAAYQRRPLTITGDGWSSIRQLLVTKHEKFKQTGRHNDIEIDDPRIQKKLERLGINYDTIPAKNTVVELLDNANLSTGGDAIDITETMHPSYKKMAIALLHDMALRYGGIDIITTEPIDKPLGKYAVIEVNSAPGLDYYIEIGEKQRARVKQLYKKVFLAMIKK